MQEIGGVKYYRSSRATNLSLSALTTASLPAAKTPTARYKPCNEVPPVNCKCHHKVQAFSSLSKGGPQWPHLRDFVSGCIDNTTMSSEKTVSSAPSMPKWVNDLNSPLPPRPKNASSIPDPPGFLSSKAVAGKKAQIVARRAPTQEETDTLKLKKSWEIALAPAKQIPMQAIMSYMSGNSLQIFSIMMVFMLYVKQYC